MAAFGWLGWGKNQRRTLVVLAAVGFLLMVVALLSTMRGGEEEYKKGEARTKTLVYENNDSGGGLGLYWMDEKANLSKATPEEINLCEKLYPNEVIPECKTTYHEKVENEK